MPEELLPGTELEARGLEGAVRGEEQSGFAGAVSTTA